MKRQRKQLGFVALMCAVGAVGLSGAPPPANVPTTAAFDDSPGRTIRSDGMGGYEEGDNCVRSWFLPSSGSYYFRTTSMSTCEYPPQSPRSVILDFSSPVAGQPSPCELSDGHGHYLNLCDENSVPDVRLFAETMFKSGSVQTPVYLAFDLYRNFVNDTAFHLNFLDPAPIYLLPGGARRIDAIGVAELSVRQAGKGGKSRLVPVARYNMAMSMTVMPTN